MIEVRQLLLLHVGPVAHRPELDHPETPAAETRAILKKEWRAGRVETNGERNERQDWSQEDDEYGADDAVDDSLGDQGSGLENRATELEEWLIVMPDEAWP